MSGQRRTAAARPWRRCPRGWTGHAVQQQRPGAGDLPALRARHQLPAADPPMFVQLVRAHDQRGRLGRHVSAGQAIPRRPGRRHSRPPAPGSRHRFRRDHPRCGSRACKIVGVITLLLAVPGHRSRAGSPDSVDGRRPRACRSARLCARPGRAARSPCSSASAAPCSCAWPRSR